MVKFKLWESQIQKLKAGQDGEKELELRHVAELWILEDANVLRQLPPCARHSYGHPIRFHSFQWRDKIDHFENHKFLGDLVVAFVFKVNFGAYPHSGQLLVQAPLLPPKILSLLNDAV